jgi:hypothetical protein
VTRGGVIDPPAPSDGGLARRRSTLTVSSCESSKFTVKAQEAIQDGQSLARRANHPNYEPEHLLRALLDQQDGVVVPMLQKRSAPT